MAGSTVNPKDPLSVFRAHAALADKEPDWPWSIFASESAALVARIDSLRAELHWIARFAQMRSEDRSAVFARVNRGALRTIAERAETALNGGPVGDPTCTAFEGEDSSK